LSYTEIVSFDENGIAKDEYEIKNAWRGAMAIWQILEKKYLGEHIPNWAKNSEIEFRINFPNGLSRCCGSDCKAMKEIWDLYNLETTSDNDKIVLFSTFDKSIVKKKYFDLFINVFELKEYKETSLKEQAEIIKQLNDNENVSAIAWNQTSVCQNRWICFEYDEEKDKPIPYNFNKQKDHYFFEIIDE
jgi:hypothetical protein